MKTFRTGTNHVHGVILLIIGILLFSGSTRAQVLTLEQCLQEAYTKSPLLKSAEHKAAGAEARIGEARSGRVPHVSFSETLTHTNSPLYSFMATLNQEQFNPAIMMNPSAVNDPDPTTNYNTRLSVQHALYTGGMVSAGLKAAEYGSEAAALELERTRQQIRYNVKATYLGVLIAGERVNVVERALHAARAHATIAGDMFETGMIVESDLLSAQVRAAELEEMLLEAVNDLALAKAALLMSMGSEQDRDFEVDPAELEVSDFLPQLDANINVALEKRPDLMALEKAIEATGQSVRVAGAAKKPHLYMMGNMDLDNSDPVDNDGESWFVGMALNVNVSDGGHTHSKVRQAQEREAELSWMREQMRQGVELEVRQAFLNVQTARKKMDVSAQAVEQADTSFKIVNDRYVNGLAINVQVLAAEAARTEARLRHLVARYEYVLGLENLRLAMGMN